MQILINAASAHMGGSVTHLQSILKWLPRQIPTGRIVAYVPEATTEVLPAKSGVDIRGYPYASTQGARRLYFDQVEIPRLAWQEEIDILFSATGFGTLWSPVPQILLVRNMKYFDPQFQAKYRELGRSFQRIRLRRWHSLLSIWAADAVLFPTRAMQETVESHISLNGTATHPLHYGYDAETFGTKESVESGTASALRQHAGADGPLLLNVSTYAVHKNLETLIEALPPLRKTYPDLTLVTTTSRGQTTDTAEYDALKQRAAELDVADAWVELGYVPHDDLPTVYQAADLYVFPSFTESFGHSMVEAMASRLPVVAAGTDVNREVCGDAGTYFEPFDSTDCAETIRMVLSDEGEQAEMRRASVHRADHFSWKRYTERLTEVFSEASEQRSSRPTL
jgi:glycosyltransferase involved in cell wall biosynthesis